MPSNPTGRQKSSAVIGVRWSTSI